MPPISFTGALTSKKKGELQDIATALRISDQGTKEDIQTRIKKHLDANPSLEDDLRFVGLFGRRKRSVQPVTIRPEKPRSTRRSDILEPVSEPMTPTRESQDTVSSSPLKQPPISPAEEEEASDAGDSVVNTSLKDIFNMQQEALLATPTSLPPPPSPAKSIIEHIAAIPAETQAVVERLKQEEVVQGGVELLNATRTFLSNSQNIWTVTALGELLYVYIATVPWKSYEVSTTGLSIPYPPLSTFQTSTFWLVLLHWAIPTLIAPALLGSLISFSPSAAKPTSDSSPSIPVSSPFDPLTAAIIRLAASIAYPYTSLANESLHIHNLDVLGYNWRVFNASLGLAFAFAEAIGGAPRAVARELNKQHPVEIELQAPGAELVIADRESEEVD